MSAVTPVETVSPFLPNYPPQPVTFVKGQGTVLWDDGGKRYLDFLSGLAVTSLGHAHPEVAAAVSGQASTTWRSDEQMVRLILPCSSTTDRLPAR